MFGDSIVDVGNVEAFAPGSLPDPPYFNGRITNGLNYADAINQAIEGIPSTASLLGGDNYAWGGATARVASAVPDLAAQVGNYLVDVGGVADPNALYLINVGGNDVRDILLDGLDGPTVIGQATTAIATQVLALQASGASRFLFVGVGDVGAIPELAPLGPLAQAVATNVAGVLNDSIEAAIAGPGVQFFDSIAFFNDVLSDPAAFGLPAGINVTDACTTVLPVDFPTCSNFAFIDNIHPTTQLHGAWGDALIAAVPEPGTGLLLGFGLLALSARRRARAA